MRCASACRGTASGPRKPGGTRPARSSRACARRSRRVSVSAERTAALRQLPSVDQILRAVAARPELADVPRVRLTATVREVLDQERRRVLAEAGAPLDADALATRV